MREDEKPKHDRQRGFTLVELLTVIAIIALLSTIAMVSLRRARIGALNARGAAEARQLMLALQLYADDYRGGFPSSRCHGTAPTCLNSDRFDVTHITCQGQDSNQICAYDATLASCLQANNAWQLNDQLRPYLGYELRTKSLLSPVQERFRSGWDSFLYISNAPAAPGRQEGAYLAWFKAGCAEFTSADCPGVLLSSNCGSARNGCAVFLGKSETEYGTNDCAWPDNATFF